MNKGRLDRLAEALEGIDRVFGRDLRSQGWVVDLNRGGAGIEVDVDYRNRVDDDFDPAMIWVLRGRRR
jgi:hypothetical protein